MCVCLCDAYRYLVLTVSKREDIHTSASSFNCCRCESMAKDFDVNFIYVLNQVVGMPAV